MSIPAYVKHLLIRPSGESQDAYNQAYSDDQPNDSSLGHEVIAGGASFAAFKAFEDHQRKEGELQYSTWPMIDGTDSR